MSRARDIANLGSNSPLTPGGTFTGDISVNSLSPVFTIDSVSEEELATAMTGVEASFTHSPTGLTGPFVTRYSDYPNTFPFFYFNNPVDILVLDQNALTAYQNANGGQWSYNDLTPGRVLRLTDSDGVSIDLTIWGDPYSGSMVFPASGFMYIAVDLGSKDAFDALTLPITSVEDVQHKTFWNVTWASPFTGFADLPSDDGVRYVLRNRDLFLNDFLAEGRSANELEFKADRWKFYNYRYMPIQLSAPIYGFAGDVVTYFAGTTGQSATITSFSPDGRPTSIGYTDDKGLLPAKAGFGQTSRISLEGSYWFDPVVRASSVTKVVEAGEVLSSWSNLTFYSDRVVGTWTGPTTPIALSGYLEPPAPLSFTFNGQTTTLKAGYAYGVYDTSQWMEVSELVNGSTYELIFHSDFFSDVVGDIPTFGTSLDAFSVTSPDTVYWDFETGVENPVDRIINHPHNRHWAIILQVTDTSTGDVLAEVQSHKDNFLNQGTTIRFLGSKDSYASAETEANATQQGVRVDFVVTRYPDMTISSGVTPLQYSAELNKWQVDESNIVIEGQPMEKLEIKNGVALNLSFKPLNFTKIIGRRSNNSDRYVYEGTIKLTSPYDGAFEDFVDYINTTRGVRVGLLDQPVYHDGTGSLESFRTDGDKPTNLIYVFKTIDDLTNMRQISSVTRFPPTGVENETIERMEVDPVAQTITWRFTDDDFFSGIPAEPATYDPKTIRSAQAIVAWKGGNDGNSFKVLGSTRDNVTTPTSPGGLQSYGSGLVLATGVPSVRLFSSTYYQKNPADTGMDFANVFIPGDPDITVPTGSSWRFNVRPGKYTVRFELEAGTTNAVKLGFAHHHSRSTTGMGVYAWIRNYRQVSTNPLSWNDSLYYLEDPFILNDGTSDVRHMVELTVYVERSTGSWHGKMNYSADTAFREFLFARTSSPITGFYLSAAGVSHLYVHNLAVDYYPVYPTNLWQSF